MLKLKVLLQGLLCAFVYYSGFIASMMGAMAFIFGPIECREGRLSFTTLLLVIMLPGIYGVVSYFLFLPPLEAKLKYMSEKLERQRAER